MHTPGPWKVDKTVALGAYGVWTDCQGDENARHVRICSVYSGGAGDVPRDERDANANLIATAPELLAACKAIQDYPWEDGQIPAALFNRIDDAIAKAESGNTTGE